MELQVTAKDRERAEAHADESGSVSGQSRFNSVEDFLAGVEYARALAAHTAYTWGPTEPRPNGARAAIAAAILQGPQ